MVLPVWESRYYSTSWAVREHVRDDAGDHHTGHRMRARAVRRGYNVVTRRSTDLPKMGAKLIDPRVVPKHALPTVAAGGSRRLADRGCSCHDRRGGTA